MMMVVPKATVTRLFHPRQPRRQKFGKNLTESLAADLPTIMVIMGNIYRIAGGFIGYLLNLEPLSLMILIITKNINKI